MSPRWQDREWIPSEGEIATLSDLANTEQGQILLRLLDESTFETLARMNRSTVPQATEIAFSQGAYQTSQRVIAWLRLGLDTELEIPALESSTEEQDG